jgi:hypothetical protein
VPMPRMRELLAHTKKRQSRAQVTREYVTELHSGAPQIESLCVKRKSVAKPPQIIASAIVVTVSATVAESVFAGGVVWQQMQFPGEGQPGASVEGVGSARQEPPSPPRVAKLESSDRLEPRQQHGDFPLP